MRHPRTTATALAAATILTLTATPARATEGGHWQSRAALTDHYGFQDRHRTALNVKTRDGSGPGCVVTAVAVSLRNYAANGDRIGDHLTQDTFNPGIVGHGSVVVYGTGWRSGAYKVRKDNGVLKIVFDVPDRHVDELHVKARHATTRMRQWPDAARTWSMKRGC